MGNICDKLRTKPFILNCLCYRILKLNISIFHTIGKNFERLRERINCHRQINMLWCSINDFIKCLEILAHRPECKCICNYIAHNKYNTENRKVNREEKCNNYHQNDIYCKKCKRKQNYISYKCLWLISVKLKCAEKLFIEFVAFFKEFDWYFKYEFKNIVKRKTEPI